MGVAIQSCGALGERKWIWTVKTKGGVQRTIIYDDGMERAVFTPAGKQEAIGLFGPGGVQACIQVEKWGSGGVSAKAGNAPIKRRQQLPLTHLSGNITSRPAHCQCLTVSIFGGAAGLVNIHALADPMPVCIGFAPGAGMREPPGTTGPGIARLNAENPRCPAGLGLRPAAGWQAPEHASS
jgi:hypothetical protein